MIRGWKYLNGGCTCARCSPWGINGYLRMAELIARTYRREFPEGKVILSTWYFDRWADGFGIVDTVEKAMGKIRMWNRVASEVFPG